MIETIRDMQIWITLLTKGTIGTEKLRKEITDKLKTAYKESCKSAGLKNVYPSDITKHRW